MKKLIKVYFVGNGDLLECYILKALKGGYYLMDTDTFHSRLWGDPPYWDIPSQVDKHNYHFFAPQDFVKFKNNKETTIFRIKIIKEFFNEEHQRIIEQIADLKEDLDILKADKAERIKAIKEESFK